MSANHVVAIDGPAASGKSSVARSLAQRLEFCYLNSGALYRALTWWALQRQISVHDSVAVAAAAEEAGLLCELVDNQARITINKIDPSVYLSSNEVNAAVSLVSRVPRIRTIVNIQLHQCAAGRDVVIEGRDIGSVVFPDTPFKFFLDAPPEVRARRRDAQGQCDQIALRDQADSSRQTAPLLRAPDAFIIDTSNLSITQVVEQILRRLAAGGLSTACAHCR